MSGLFALAGRFVLRVLSFERQQDKPAHGTKEAGLTLSSAREIVVFLSESARNQTGEND
jgi:hypothetical protein